MLMIAAQARAEDMKEFTEPWKKALKEGLGAEGSDMGAFVQRFGSGF